MSVYGRTFAAELNDKGKHQEAIESASQMIDKDADNPEHWYDRAIANVALGRHADAVGDVERAMVVDKRAMVLDDDELDDMLWSSLLAVARGEGESGTARLDHYVQVVPAGRHVAEVGDWKRRLRGELKSDWVKAR